jgi:hypothetical protein
MDAAFNPKQELIRLLGPTPKHPWAALIPQILLWCFRRFCVQKLLQFDGTLEESLCEDILDIVHTYCPKGLELVSIEWFTPENIEQVSSALHEYMGFFIRFCKNLDSTIDANDYEWQDRLSEFLDESMAEIISGWLDKQHSCFLIFPTEAEDDDQFSESQFSKLINSLLIYSYAEKQKPVEPQPLRRAHSLLWQLISIPGKGRVPFEEMSLALPPVPSLFPELEPAAGQKEEQEVPVAAPQPEPEPQPQPAPEVLPTPIVETAAVLEPSSTVKEAVRRRRTLCVKGRRAQEARVKTRKTHPAPYTKERV